MSSLEIHIPISPTCSFFNMIHYFAVSLREFGGQFADARVIVSVGGDCEPFDIAAAHPHLARHDITWRWLDRQTFQRLSYLGTGLDRWVEPFEADFVMMADADLLFVSDFSEVAAQLAQPRGIAGAAATMPPWLVRDASNVDRERWEELFARAGLPPPIFDCPHPGLGLWYPVGGGMEAGPAYFNFGFVLGTRDAMHAIAKTFPSDYFLAADFMETDLSAQVGLALSIVRNSIPYRVLPARYNFWGDPRFYLAFPEEAANIRVLHYLNGPFRKHHDNGSPADVAAWLEAQKDNENEQIQFVAAVVRKAHESVMRELSQ